MSAVPPVVPVPSTIETRLAAIEAAIVAKAKAEESTISTWLKANWAHFVTWGGLAIAFVKHIV
jgi:hypothetical protein